MLKDLFDVVKEFFSRIKASRLILIAAVYAVLTGVLVSRLYDLQIVNGANYLETYIEKAEKTVTTPATRGNIYDRNGKLLAYNRLTRNVVVQDNGEYRTIDERNRMLLRLVRILFAHGEKVVGRFEVQLSEDGTFRFTSASEEARKRFLRDVYGLRSVSELDDEAGEYPSDITAEELVRLRAKAYRLDERLRTDAGVPETLTDEELLALVNIRYTMGLTAYQRYEATTVAERVAEETAAELFENQALLLGVGTQEKTERVYNDSIPFSSIIGYVGRVQEDQLKDLQQTDESYAPDDIVGRTGIEAYMEKELHGVKGRRTMYVDNVGHIMEVTSETDPVPGNDVYLSIDRDLQIGIYHLLEQHLAGVLADKLVNMDEPNDENTDASKRLIPIKDAYYQLIGNNVLSLKHMAGPEATLVERQIREKIDGRIASSEALLRGELTNTETSEVGELPDDVRAYMYFIYSMLSDPASGVIMRDRIDTNGETYSRWRSDSISLREFLLSGIREGWIDTTKLGSLERYADEERIYSALTDHIIEALHGSGDYEKLVCRYLVKNETLTGAELCIALLDQGILPQDDEERARLLSYGDEYAFRFFVQQVSEIKITPAQLALDPCTAGCVVTDVTTGKVRALVSYPGYDNNRLTNVMDAEYYGRLVADQSLPLYNNATQARKAPGSTFKPITAVAGLEEGVIGLYDTITCTGLYDTITPPMRCWIYPGYHGSETIVEAIRNSCNFYFGEVGHRLSTDANGGYSQNLGIERIRKYASMFGLDHKSGIEITENEPMITNEAPEQSSIGQGTHSYANVQLSRYVTTIANRGTVFELSLLDHTTDWEGGNVRTFEPKVGSRIDISDTTWNAVQRGMREVIQYGSARQLFTDLEVDIAGKTGTAQESRNRANHAFFISFGPYEDPSIAVTVNIPYGYTSTNAASVSKDVYRLCFGYTSLDYILNTGAQSASSVEIND